MMHSYEFTMVVMGSLQPHYVVIGKMKNWYTGNSAIQDSSEPCSYFQGFSIYRCQVWLAFRVFLTSGAFTCICSFVIAVILYFNQSTWIRLYLGGEYPPNDHSFSLWWKPAPGGREATGPTVGISSPSPIFWILLTYTCYIPYVAFYHVKSTIHRCMLVGWSWPITTMPSFQSTMVSTSDQWSRTDFGHDEALLGSAWIIIPLSNWWT